MIIIETPGAFASLKVWERYRARLEAARDGKHDTPAMEAADRYIAHLRVSEGATVHLGDSSSAK